MATAKGGNPNQGDLFGSAEPAKAAASAPGRAKAGLGPRPAEPSPLMLASQESNARLALAMLDLPIDWDPNEVERDAEGKPKGLALANWLGARRSLPNESRWLSEEAAAALNAQRERVAERLLGIGGDLWAAGPEGSALEVACQWERVAFLRAAAAQIAADPGRLAATRVHGSAEVCPPGRLGEPRAKAMGLLGHAAERDNIELAKLLLEVGHPVDERGLLGGTALSWAKSAEMAQLLLEAGANPLEKDAEGVAPLARIQERVGDSASREALTKALSMRMAQAADGLGKEEAQAAREALRRENLPALFTAAREGNQSNLVKVAASFKFDMKSALEPESGRTLLMAALMGGRLSSAKLLIERGVDPKAFDKQGIGTLAYALRTMPYTTAGLSGAQAIALVLRAGGWAGRGPLGLSLGTQTAMAAEGWSAPNVGYTSEHQYNWATALHGALAEIAKSNPEEPLARDPDGTHWSERVSRALEAACAKNHYTVGYAAKASQELMVKWGTPEARGQMMLWIAQNGRICPEPGKGRSLSSGDEQARDAIKALAEAGAKVFLPDGKVPEAAQKTLAMNPVVAALFDKAVMEAELSQARGLSEAKGGARKPRL